MRMLQTTLLTGPYDWEPALLPRAEFDARLERVRAAMRAGGADALLIHGHAGDYGALAYVTAFVPKLGPALALVKHDAIAILTSGTALMLPQARRLTWVADVQALGRAPAQVAAWLGKDARLATWGAASMPHGLYRGIVAALPPAAPIALDAPLEAIRRRKSPCELGLMRDAGRMLRTAMAAFASAARSGLRPAALAAERAGMEAGAQDVRVLASLRPGGPPLPVDEAGGRVIDPLVAAIAVQHAGYWAAGHDTLAAVPDAACDAARQALAALVAAVRPGASVGALTDATGCTVTGHAIGLSLEEGPIEPLASGVTASLAVTVPRADKADKEASILSALVAVNESGAELLWSPLG